MRYIQEAIKGYILVHTVIFLFLWFFLLITNLDLSLHCTYIKLDLFSFLARKFSFLFPDWMCLVDISKKGSFWGPSNKEMLLERVNKTTKVQRLMQILRVKGTVSWDFRQFVCLKDSAWAPYEQEITVWRTFSFSWRNSIAKFENHIVFVMSA